MRSSRRYHIMYTSIIDQKQLPMQRQRQRRAAIMVSSTSCNMSTQQKQHGSIITSNDDDEKPASSIKRQPQKNTKKNNNSNKIHNFHTNLRKLPAREAEDKLFHAVHQYEVDPTNSLKPLLWHRPEQLAQMGAAREAQELLDVMHHLYDEGRHYHWLRPQVTHYSSIINAWMRSGEAGYLDQVDGLLQEMEDLFSSPSCGLSSVADADARSNQIAYNKLIHGLAKAGELERAERMLEQMSSSSSGCVPDIVSFNGVLHALAKSGKRGSAQRAEELLQRLEVMHYEQNSNANEIVRPDLYTYNTVIDAWAKSCKYEPDAAERAEALLRRMEEMYASGNKSVKPDTVSYTTVIDAWSKSGNKAVAGERADALLKSMDDMFLSGNEDVKPNVFTFTACLNAFAASNDPARAEALFERMHRMFDATGNEDIRPSVETYNAMIKVWAHSGRDDAPEQAQALLSSMNESSKPMIMPNVISFNTVLNMWALRACTRPDAVERAEDIVKVMESLYEDKGDPRYKPNERTYTTLMKCWLRSSGVRDAVERVDNLFEVMRKMYHGGDSDFKPNHISYLTVMIAWVKCESTDAGRRTEELLSQMQMDGVRPNTAIINCAIEALSQCTDNFDEAVVQAEKLLFTMNDMDIQPNENTLKIMHNIW
eukprot:CAMPEP_0116026082 /NCGR_PEP_ID=MMETSP0321-20121206/13575_1 /TAXON_ID=163516 /ORGANISM="Leptocylindrus danicus var. danicus, Strain B650" /LENGTH=651 /DNA_ID=CAMNT_0003498685 /DNA_START=121 /DNA_END=2074 /DNA_ORIENTATION=-